jgi:protein-tyrosine phosphatase
MSVVLFICTGNYYRSRFAEILFNHLVPETGIDWRATSRGLAAQESGNVGPISKFTLERLKLRNIPIGDRFRFPLQLEEKDLLEANLVIALDRNEHLPRMKEKFAAWADQITYWDVPDLNITHSEDALSRIECNIYALIRELEAERA